MKKKKIAKYLITVFIRNKSTFRQLNWTFLLEVGDRFRRSFPELFWWLNEQICGHNFTLFFKVTLSVHLIAVWYFIVSVLDFDLQCIETIYHGDFARKTN